MNFKTKAIGLLAGSALAFSVATGAMAQTDNAEVDLVENHLGDCTASISGSQDLGAYTWDTASKTWTVDSGAATSNDLQVAVNQNVAGSVVCTVAVDVSELTLDGGSATITDLTLSGSNGVSGSSPFTITTLGTTTPGATFNVAVAINSVPAANPAGTYVGDVTIGSVSAPE